MRFFWDTQYYMDAQQLIFPYKLQTYRYSFHNVTTTSSIPFKHKEEHRILQHYPFTVNFLSHGKSHINTFVIKHVQHLLRSYDLNLPFQISLTIVSQQCGRFIQLNNIQSNSSFKDLFLQFTVLEQFLICENLVHRCIKHR